MSAGAASLKDVNYSQKGEQAMARSPFSEQALINSAVANASEILQEKRHIYKLVDSKRNGRLWLDGMDDVINPETGKKERIRLLRGVDTIWMKEQKDLDKEYINKNRRSLMFEGGICILVDSDTAGVQFAELSNNFTGNPKRIIGKKHNFFKWDPSAQEKAALAATMEKVEVMQLANSQPFDKLKKHAAFLGGISFVDEMGEARSEEGIRTLYIGRAMESPKRFKETLGSKEVEVHYMVKRAILDAKIDLGNANGTIRWGSGGGIITKTPKGVDATRVLIDLAMSPTDEGKTFLEQLTKIVS